ncbi:MAG: hypothetical protein ACOX5G_11710 [Kiritimatiellia bacterium]
MGVFLLALGGVFLFAPASPEGPVARFPRNVALGRTLCALAFVWATCTLYAKPLEFLLPIQKWIWPAMLVSIPLSWAAMPDLLTCRAMGGLLCLLPAPVLAVGRFHPSPLRLVVIVFLYLLAVAGMVFLMSPHHLRIPLAWVASSPVRQRGAGAVSAVLGALFALLALGVFRG